MFISQSILSSDREMLIRLAHEMSHSWFGLIIGPRDWTEEWLSEGFCTYTECYLHSTVMQVCHVTHLIRTTRLCTFENMRPVKTQTSLHIRLVCSELLM